MFSGSLVFSPLYLATTSLHPHQISRTPTHPNFIYGLRSVVLGSTDVGAVFGLLNWATAAGSLRNSLRRRCASAVPPRIEVVGGPKPISDMVGTAKSDFGPVRCSAARQL